MTDVDLEVMLVELYQLLHLQVQLGKLRGDDPKLD